MSAVTYTVEVSACAWEPWWTEWAGQSYNEAVTRCEREVTADSYARVQLVEWEEGRRVRTTQYGRED